MNFDTKMFDQIRHKGFFQFLNYFLIKTFQWLFDFPSQEADSTHLISNVIIAILNGSNHTDYYN